jgi:predicted small lipoprotein YifL
MRVTLPVVLLMCLAGCGQKGPLYLPPPQPPEEAALTEQQPPAAAYD